MSRLGSGAAPGSRVVASLRHRWRRTAAGAVVAALAVTGAGIAIRQNGYALAQLTLAGGGVWLPSRSVGQLSLIDGQSAQVAAQVQVSAAGDDVSAVQAGSDAYVVNRTRGTLVRVDGAYQTASAQVVVLPDAGDRLQSFATAGALYVFDGKRGILQRADPHTMALLGQPVALAATPGDEGAVIDAAGTMWLVDTNGTLLRYAGADVSRKTGLATDATLVRVGDRVALIEPSARRARLLDPNAASFDASACYDTGEDPSTRVAGDHASSRLYTVSGTRGVLQTIDLAHGSCSVTMAALATPGDTLADPIENGGRLFVPDTTTGQVLIVDLATRTLIAAPKVLAPGVSFQLLSKDNTVYFNDPASDKAGVVRIDGTVAATHKYDPANPSKGLTNPKPITGATPKTSTPARPGKPSAPLKPRPSAAAKPTVKPSTPAAPAAPATPAAPTPSPTPTPTVSPAPAPAKPSEPSEAATTPAAPPAPLPTPTVVTTAPATPPAPADVATPTTRATTAVPAPGSTATAPPTPTPNPSVRIVSSGSAVAGQAVTFSIESNGGAVAQSAAWTFEPAATGSGLTVTHTFAAAGSYNVVAQVTLAGGQTQSASATVVIAAAPMRYNVHLVAHEHGHVVMTTPSGVINCPPTCDAYDQTATITLKAVPDQYWDVGAWGGDCAGTSGDTCTRSSQSSVIADFVPGAPVGPYAAGGQTLYAPATAVSAIGGHYDPLNQRVVFAEYGGNSSTDGRIGSINVVTGAYIVLGTGYNTPEDVLPLADGSMYVSERGAGDIVRIPATGADRADATVFASGLIEPHQLYINDAQTHLYVIEHSNSGTGRLLRYGYGADPGPEVMLSNLKKATGFAIDSAEHYAYVSDQSIDSIVQLPMNGFFGAARVLAPTMHAPFFLSWADDARTALLVPERANGTVHRVDVGTGADTVAVAPAGSLTENFNISSVSVLPGGNLVLFAANWVKGFPAP